MIIESGALYFVLQLTTLSVYHKALDPYAILPYYTVILWPAFIQITVMYPTIVLLLVEQKRSMADMECFIPTLHHQICPD